MNASKFSFFLFFCLFFLPCCAFSESLYKAFETRYVMGTLLEITLYSEDKNLAQESIEKSFKIAQDLDNLLSNYKENSELSLLNKNAGSHPVSVSETLWEFLELSKVLSRETSRYFDPSISPVLELYRKNKFPSKSEKNTALNLIGINKIAFLPNKQISFSKKGISLDSGGIGKGFAVDKIVAYLKSKKITHGLINFGHSSIYALGNPPKQDSWKLKLEFPDGSKYAKDISLRDEAFTASFSFAQSKKDSSKTEAHIINPLTGEPLRKDIKTLVFSQSASLGEALSKYALFVGCEKQKRVFWGEEISVTRIQGSFEEICNNKTKSAK